MSPLPGAPNVGVWFVLRQVPSKKVRTLRARGLLATPLERPSEILTMHDNGDTECLPRFRPPCGVKPYSCLSDGLHCGSYSTSCELVLWIRLGRLESELAVLKVRRSVCGLSSSMEAKGLLL